MITLKSTKQLSVNFCLLTLVLLLAAHTVSAQVTIGGITISKSKRPHVKVEKNPSTGDTTGNNSETKNGSPAKAAPANTQSAAKPPEEDYSLRIFLDDIKKAKTEVERYDPAQNLYLVSAGATSESLLRAVSPKAREAWAEQWLKTPASRDKFNMAFDDLAASAAKKLPLYKPDASRFKFRDAVSEKLLMNYFKDTSKIKVFRIGVGTAGWLIQRGDDGLPSYRYRIASVYLRDSRADHPYCAVVSATVKQDYAGGGTYSTETYRSSAEEELFGCP